MSQQENSDHFGSIPISQGSDSQKSVNAPQISPSESPPDIQDNETTFSRKNIPPKRNGTPFLRTTQILATIALLSVGIYLLGGYYLFPYLIKTYGAQKLTELTGRDVTISRAKFNPLKLRLELGNSIVGALSHSPEDHIDPVFSFSRLSLELNPRSLFHKGLICNEFSVNQLFVHITKDVDGAINIEDIWKQLFKRPQSQAATNTFSSLLAPMGTYLKSHYSLNNISINNSEIIFADATTNKKHHINSLHIELPTIATIDYHPPRVKPHFSAIINGTPVSLTDSPNYDPDSAIIQFALNMTKIDIMTYKSYLPTKISQHVKSGEADIDVQITYNPRAKKTAEQLQLSGVVNLGKVLFKENTGSTTIDSILLKGSFFPLSKNFLLTKLIFTKPTFTMTLSEQTSLTLSTPFNLLQNPLSASGKNHHISHLEIIRGTMKFINKATPDTVQQWDNIKLLVATPPPPPKSNSIPALSDFSFYGKKGQQTTISTQGIINTERSVKGLVEAKNLDVASLSLMSNWFTDSIITKGTASHIKANFSYDQKSDNKHVTLENVTIEAKNIVISETDTPLAFIEKWQSENGFFFASDSVFHLGSVSLNKGTFYVYAPTNPNEQWQNLVTPSSSPSKNKTTFRTTISSIAIVDSQIILKGSSSPQQVHTLNQFELTVPQISQDRQNLFTAKVLSNKSPINISGAFSTNSFKANGHLKAEAIPTALLNTLFVPDLLLRTKGTVRLDGSFSLPSLSYEGAVSLSGFSLSNSECTFISRQANSSSVVITTNPFLLSLGRLSLDQPHIDYPLDKTINSSLALFTREPTSQTKENPVKIDALYIRDGKLTLNNNHPEPSFITTLEQINGSFETPTTGNVSTFSFKGQLDTIAPFTVKGTTAIFSPVKTFETTYQINNYPAHQKSSFWAPFIGYIIDTGKLSLAGKVQASPSTISHSLNISIADLKLGNDIDTKLIKIKGDLWKDTLLLQALLQNKEGQLTIPLSITSNSVDSNYNQGDAFTKQFAKLLLKARVSPLSLLGENVQTGPIPSTVFFPLGSPTLSAANLELLDNLTSQLIHRPLMRITISGYSDSHSDRKALIDERIAEIDRRQRKHEEKLSQALSTSYGKEVIDQPFSIDYATSKGAHDSAKKIIRISDKDLLKLARKRIEEVAVFFRSKGVPENQFMVGKTEVIDSQYLGRDGNRIDLGVGL